MFKKLPKNHKKGPGTSGFTLVELLVVVGVLVVLLSILLIIINPARQLAQDNNTQRRSDVDTILKAVHQYAADNNGQIPTGIPTSAADTIGSAYTDICDDLVPTYIAEMPVDPVDGSWSDCNSYDTGYTIVATTSPSRTTVAAPSAELSVTIDITR